MKALSKIQREGYFEDLSETLKEFTRKAFLKAVANKEGPDGWKSDDECIEEIEFRSRDGFFASSYNKGGLEYTNFTDLMCYFGGGYVPAHEGAAKEIARQIQYNSECLNEEFFKEHSEILAVNGVSEQDLSYSALSENPNLQHLAETYSDRESDGLACEDSSIMHSFRIMYHGCAGGIHSASISAAINTEGPYHRSSISWAPNVFCEGAKEIEISWKTESGFKTKLVKALKQVSKEIF